MKPKRPVLLYLLVFLCLLGTLLSVLTMIGTIQTWNWFHTFSASLLPIYMIFKGFFLALGWLTAAFLLWKLYLWSIYFCAANAILTTIWLWVDRLILSQNPMPVSRHVFLMVINILLLVLFGFLLPLLKPYLHHPQSESAASPFSPLTSTGAKNDKTSV